METVTNQLKFGVKELLDHATEEARRANELEELTRPTGERYDLRAFYLSHTPEVQMLRNLQREHITAGDLNRQPSPSARSSLSQ